MPVTIALPARDSDLRAVEGQPTKIAFAEGDLQALRMAIERRLSLRTQGGLATGRAGVVKHAQGTRHGAHVVTQLQGYFGFFVVAQFVAVQQLPKLLFVFAPQGRLQANETGLT